MDSATIKVASGGSLRIRQSSESTHMYLARFQVENFRGIATADVSLSGNTVLLGDNKSGKSTLLEAVELALGADRLFRRPVIDEHDLYGGRLERTSHCSEEKRIK